ncbi:MAG: hypothetical protein KTR25_04220 [Myxococcales bacterium]|nr:hypothetical protein [Myxococcales bacterium]
MSIVGVIAHNVHIYQDQKSQDTTPITVEPLSFRFYVAISRDCVGHQTA